MLTSSVNSNFRYILKRERVLKMNISGLFNISLRLLLDEHSISRVNGLWERVKFQKSPDYFRPKLCLCAVKVNGSGRNWYTESGSHSQ